MHLVGDIGATNARFALVDAKGGLIRASDLLCRDHPSMADAITSYLSAVNGAAPRRAVLAVATTPRDDRVSFTNNPWAFSIGELASQLGISDLRVINDFHANALALPHLSAADVLKVGSGGPVERAPMAVLGLVPVSA